MKNKAADGSGTSKFPNVPRPKKGDIREEKEGGGRLRHLEGAEEEACRACDERGGYRSAGELTC